MWPTIFTLTSLTSNPQFWHVLIQFSLLYTFRNYILSNSRRLHHLFFIINFASFAKNIFPSLKNEKHFYFGLNIYNRMSKCSIKTKCEIKKNLLWRIPTLNSGCQPFLRCPQSCTTTPTSTGCWFPDANLLCLSHTHLRQVRQCRRLQRWEPTDGTAEINRMEHMSTLEKLLLSTQSKTIQSLSQMAITFIPEAFQNTGF